MFDACSITRCFVSFVLAGAIAGCTVGTAPAPDAGAALTKQSDDSVGPQSCSTAPESVVTSESLKAVPTGASFKVDLSAPNTSAKFDLSAGPIDFRRIQLVTNGAPTNMQSMVDGLKDEAGVDLAAEPSFTLQSTGSIVHQNPPTATNTPVPAALGNWGCYRNECGIACCARDVKTHVWVCTISITC